MICSTCCSEMRYAGTESFGLYYCLACNDGLIEKMVLATGIRSMEEMRRIGATFPDATIVVLEGSPNALNA